MSPLATIPVERVLDEFQAGTLSKDAAVQAMRRHIEAAASTNARDLFAAAAVPVAWSMEVAEAEHWYDSRHDAERSVTNVRVATRAWEIARLMLEVRSQC